jgi:zinc transport system substrate-binding protein
MVMVVAVSVRALVARDPVAGVDALHEPELGERLERPVDRRDPDRTPSLPQPVVDLVRAQTAVLTTEQLDDCRTRAAASKTGPFQGLVRLLRPAHRPSVSSRGVISRIVLILIGGALLAGCGSATGKGRTSVVAAFYPLAYAAERVGGPAYDVRNLTPPGAEPHDLELTPRAIGNIESADVVLYLGHGFQPAVAKAAREGKGMPVDLLAGLPLHDSDPHVWLDPVLYARIVRRVASALHRPAGPLLADLRRLDRDYRSGLSRCARREIVTSHEAFGYLARRYGLRQVAITGITPEAEPSPQRLADVIRLVRKTHATTVFFETLVSPRLADAVARDVGARTAVLDPIEGAKDGATYLTLMHANLTALRKALGCR